MICIIIVIYQIKYDKLVEYSAEASAEPSGCSGS